MPDELLDIEAASSSSSRAEALDALFRDRSARIDSPSAERARIFAARSALLERRLGELFASAFPRQGIEWSVGAVGGPRVLGVAELERVRDALAVEAARRLRPSWAGAARPRRRNRGLLEAMVAEPRALPVGAAVRARTSASRGCRHWHSRPRWGILGMLMGWWRVKLSSGCPLAEGRRPPEPEKRRKRRPRRATRTSGAAPRCREARARGRSAPRRRGRRAAAGALGVVPPGRAGRPGRALILLVGGLVVQSAARRDDDRRRPGAGRARGARALDSRALRGLPLPHAAPLRRGRDRGPGRPRDPRLVAVAPDRARRRRRASSRSRPGRWPERFAVARAWRSRSAE